jgi:hypothetical protein
MYPSDGLQCVACRHVWQPTILPERDTCPECGSEEFVDSYPEVPDLTDQPLLFFIYAAEQHIPRDERGTILTREMVAWLRLHGVRERSEVMQWEEWFRAIGAFRARLQEELTETPTEGDKEDRED